MRSFFRERQHQKDRALHPGRHQQARQLLRKGDPPARILVVCHANICRSPYLEVALRAALPNVDVQSAGFMGGGRPVPPHSITVASRKGFDLVPHRSKMLSRDLLDSSDLIIVMDTQQAEALKKGFGVEEERILVAGDLDPRESPTRAIADPWRQPLKAFESSFERLDRVAATVASILKQKQD